MEKILDYEPKSSPTVVCGQGSQNVPRINVELQRSHRAGGQRMRKAVREKRQAVRSVDFGAWLNPEWQAVSLDAFCYRQAVSL